MNQVNESALLRAIAFTVIFLLWAASLLILDLYNRSVDLMMTLIFPMMGSFVFLFKKNIVNREVNRRRLHKSNLAPEEVENMRIHIEAVTMVWGSMPLIVWLLIVLGVV